MSKKTLGRLEKVELREAWSSESADFTPWLAQEENLGLLGHAIGIDLELESQEKSVGPFRADILCRDTLNDSWVLIENQLERTDHTHLGQLLTYVAGLEAVAIVWVSARFTDEHRATLDWLNEHTDGTINLFGLEIELWRIDDSPIAPKFNIISQPNDWSRSVQQATRGREISAHGQFLLNYWTAYNCYMEDHSSFLRCQKPQPQNWMYHALGRSGIRLASTVSTRNSELNEKGPEIRAEVYIDGPTAKTMFAFLEKEKLDIESKLGFTLNWHNPEDKKMCRIFKRLDTEVTDESLWLEQFAWFRDHLENLHMVIAPIVKRRKEEGTI